MALYTGGGVAFSRVTYDGQMLRTPDGMAFRLGVYLASGSGAVVHAVSCEAVPPPLQPPADAPPPGPCAPAPRWPARLRRGAAAALKICNPIAFPPVLQGNALSRCWLLHRGAAYEAPPPPGATSAVAGAAFTIEHVWWLWDPITLATVAAYCPAGAPGGAGSAWSGPPGPCEPQPPQPCATGLRELTLPLAMAAWGVNPPQARLAEGPPLLPRGAPPHAAAASAANAPPGANVQRSVFVRGRAVTIPVVPDRYLRFLSAYAVACREVGIHARVAASASQVEQDEEAEAGGDVASSSAACMWPPHILRLEAVLEQVRDYECVLMLLMERADKGDLFSFIQTHAASYTSTPTPTPAAQGEQGDDAGSSSGNRSGSGQPNAAVPRPWESPDAEVRGQWVARGVLGGLSALHSAGIAHRDVKPENVLLLASSEGEVQAGAAAGGPPHPPALEVRLSDFGLAALLDTEATPAIASPPAGVMTSAAFFGRPSGITLHPPSALVLAGIAGRMVPADPAQTSAYCETHGTQEQEGQDEELLRKSMRGAAIDGVPELCWEGAGGGSASSGPTSLASVTGVGLASAAPTSGPLSPAFFRAAAGATPPQQRGAAAARAAGLPPISPARGTPPGLLLPHAAASPAPAARPAASPLVSPSGAVGSGAIPDSPALRGMAPAFANVRREEGTAGAPFAAATGGPSGGGGSSGPLSGRRRLTSSSSAASLASMCLSPRPSPPGSPTLSALFPPKRGAGGGGGGGGAVVSSPLGPRPPTPTAGPAFGSAPGSCPASPALGPATFAIVPAGPVASPLLQPLGLAPAAAASPLGLPAAPSPLLQQASHSETLQTPGAPLQRVKSIVGSPLYAAPELIALSAARSGASQAYPYQTQAQGQAPADSYDPRLADAWSVGVVLYALLTGSLPFQERLLACPRFARWCAWIRAREDRASAVRGALAAYDEALAEHEAATNAWAARAQAAAAAAAEAAAAAAALSAAPSSASSAAHTSPSTSRTRQRGRRRASVDAAAAASKQGRRGSASDAGGGGSSGGGGKQRRGTGKGCEGAAEVQGSGASSPSSDASQEHSPGFGERAQRGVAGAQRANGQRGLWGPNERGDGNWQLAHGRSRSPPGDGQAALAVQQRLWGGGETPQLPLPNALHHAEAGAREVDEDPNADASAVAADALEQQAGQGIGGGRQWPRARQAGAASASGQGGPSHRQALPSAQRPHPQEAATPKRGSAGQRAAGGSGDSGGGAGGAGSSGAALQQHPRRSVTAPLPAHSPEGAHHWAGVEDESVQAAHGGEEAAVHCVVAEGGSDGEQGVRGPRPRSRSTRRRLAGNDFEVDVGDPPAPPVAPTLPAPVPYPGWFFCGPELSIAAKELLSGLLHPDPARRLTVAEALAHPWTQGLLGPASSEPTALPASPSSSLPWWVTTPQPEALTAEMVMAWRAALQQAAEAAAAAAAAATEEEECDAEVCCADPCNGQVSAAPPGGGVGADVADDGFCLGPASLSFEEVDGRQTSGDSKASGDGGRMSLNTSLHSSGGSVSGGERRPSVLNLSSGQPSPSYVKVPRSGSTSNSVISSPVLGFLASGVLRGKSSGGVAAASPLLLGGKPQSPPQPPMPECSLPPAMASSGAMPPPLLASALGVQQPPPSSTATGGAGSPPAQ